MFGERRREIKRQKFVESLRQEPPVECPFKVGDEVTFTNEYGVAFPGLRIVGFDEDDSFYGRFIYLNDSAWWFPCKQEQLTPGKEIPAHAIAIGNDLTW